MKIGFNNYIFDSSCWLEYFAGSINCKEYSKIIQNTDKIIIPTIIFYEVFKKLLLETDENTAISLIAHLRECKVVDIDFNISLEAARTSIEEKIPMADSIIFTVSKHYKCILYTHDSHFKDIDDNIKYIEKI